MSTHVPWFRSFYSLKKNHFVLAKLSTKQQRGYFYSPPSRSVQAPVVAQLVQVKIERGNLGFPAVKFSSVETKISQDKLCKK